MTGKLRSLNKMITLLIMGYLLLFPLNNRGYQNGIENGDIVIIRLEGKIIGGDRYGEIIEPDHEDIFEVTRTNLIDGLYDEIIGMKILQEKRNVIIQADKAYYDDPAHELFGEILVYDIFIKELIINQGNKFSTNEDQSLDSSEKGFYSIIEGMLIAISSFFGLTLIFLYFRKFYLKKLKKQLICVRCLSKSEGHCSKCGSLYCRKDFSINCGNCGNNGFLSNVNQNIS